MNALLKNLATWIQGISLHQWGLILTFAGSLMIAADVVGQELFERMEKAVQRRIQRTKNKTVFLMHSSLRTLRLLVTRWWPIGFFLLILLVIMTVFRFVLPLTGGRGVIYTVIIEVWTLIWGASVGILTVIMLAAGVFFAIFGLLWLFRILVWLFLSPLVVGQYLKEKYDLKGAVPITGVLILATGLVFELIASRR